MFVTDMLQVNFGNPYVMFLAPQLMRPRGSNSSGACTFLFRLRVCSLEMLWNFMIQRYLGHMKSFKKPVLAEEVQFHVVLDIDKTLLLSVKAEDCSQTQLNYAVRTIHADGVCFC